MTKLPQSKCDLVYLLNILPARGLSTLIVSSRSELGVAIGRLRWSAVTSRGEGQGIVRKAPVIHRKSTFRD
jgi:hypothetical protein